MFVKMAVVYFLAVAFQLSLLASVEANYRDILVSTTAGNVTGVQRESAGAPYHLFAGIPYAEPPVGSLRLRAPVAKTPWEGVFNATVFGQSCPQNIWRVGTFTPDSKVEFPGRSMETGEDCLTLNVYTPSVNVTDNGWAVMVWLHGGGYEHGQGSTYDGSVLAVIGRVVVVTINYRLGPLGFLYTGDDNGPGNFGFKDQQLALEWVRDNIMAFGGDPSKVTLFGQADLYESATLHLRANGSRPLFRGVVAHSPNRDYSYNMSMYPYDWDAISNTRLFASFANCTRENSSMLVECLQSKTVEEIQEATSSLYKTVKSSYVWRPVFSEDFFGWNPDDGIKHDLLILFNSGDGSIVLELMRDTLQYENKTFDIADGVTEDQFNWWLRSYIKTESKVSDLAIKERYIDKDTVNKNFARMKALVDLHLDLNNLRFNAENLDELKPNLDHIFMMIFDYRSPVNDTYSDIGVVPHGAEIPYVFGLPFIRPGVGDLYTDKERELSDRMNLYWTNFAKSGNPLSNGTGSPWHHKIQIMWPEYGEFVEVQLNGETVDQGYRSEEVYFWNDYLPELNEAACPVPPTQTPTQTTPTQTTPTETYPSHTYPSLTTPTQSPTQTTTGEPPEGCENPVVIGGSLGFTLGPTEAESLIVTLMFLIIAFLCLLVLVIGAAMGYKSKSKMLLKSLQSVENGEKRYEDHSIPNPTGLQAEALTETPRYKNVQFNGSTHVETDRLSTPDDSDGEADPLPQKRIPVDDEPAYASVDKSMKTQDDEEPNFPPPPDDWSRAPESDLSVDASSDPEVTPLAGKIQEPETPADDNAVSDDEPSEGEKSLENEPTAGLSEDEVPTQEAELGNGSLVSDPSIEPDDDTQM